MSIEHIRRSLDQSAQHLAEHPQDALYLDAPAVAVIETGLRCRADGPDGAVLFSDMAARLGGGGSAPSPGWLLRAALANCDATVVAMRAAQLGITLRRLEVTVETQSDDRGILGLADAVPAGPLSFRVRIRIAADDTSPEQLHALVRWAEAHSPVSDAVRRAVPCTTEVSVE
jgi:uncharacterized OsmC-like protein